MRSPEDEPAANRPSVDDRSRSGTPDQETTSRVGESEASQTDPWPTARLGGALTYQFSQSIKIPDSSSLIPEDVVKGIQLSQREWAEKLARGSALRDIGQGSLVKSQLTEAALSMSLPRIDPRALESLRTQSAAFQKVAASLRLATTDINGLASLTSQANALREIAETFTSSSRIDLSQLALTQDVLPRLSALAESQGSAAAPEDVATAVSEAVLAEVQGCEDYDWSDPRVRVSIACATAGYVLLWCIYLYLTHPKFIESLDTVTFFIQIANASALAVNGILRATQSGGTEPGQAAPPKG